MTATYAELGIDPIASLMSFGAPDPELVNRSLRRLGKRVLPGFAR